MSSLIIPLLEHSDLVVGYFLCAVGNSRQEVLFQMAGLVATATDVEMKSSSSPSSSSSISASVWAGFLGGLVGTVVSYPFDTLRVVSQTSSFSEGSRGSNYKALPSTGLWQSYRNMQSRNLSLYSGIGPAMMSQGLLYGFLFGTKIVSKKSRVFWVLLHIPFR